MWSWSSKLSVEMNIDKNIIENFKKHAKISGTIFIIIGVIGIIFPSFMSLTTVAFVAYLMLIAGLIGGYLT